MRPRNFALVAGSALMCGVLVSCSGTSGDTEAADHTVAKSENIADGVTAAGNGDRQGPAIPDLYEHKPNSGPYLGGLTKKRMDEQLLAEYKCRVEDCANSIFAAGSVSEASWLKGRGYPRPMWAAELNRKSNSELAIEAERGDLAAQAILGRRLIETGNKADGLGRLNIASVKGSVFADFQLSEAFKKVNMIESAAYLRRAYLQGDTKAAHMMYVEFPAFSAAEWALVDQRAMSLYAGLLAQRAGKGRFQYGPRPNPN